MRFFSVCLLLCIVEIISASPCFQYREPCMIKQACTSCLFADTFSGVATCSSCSSCPQATSNSLCCGMEACNCYKDTSKTCTACDNSSPVCSCLAALDGKSCNCNKKSFVYFPEVEYPVSMLEVKPYYYSSCWNY